MKCNLSAICHFVKGKIDVSLLSKSNYISTENMNPNKGGVCEATTLPSSLQTQIYECGDVLVSNIRPYFKKIWRARTNGGCSNDVLVFRANPDIDSTFLYYVLADDNFFEYSTATSKGTKMPRGDKVAIMKYSVPTVDFKTQQKIASILSALDDKIELNNKMNENLEQQAQAIFKSWFVDFEPWGGTCPEDWEISTLDHISIMGAGGDKPKSISTISTEECPYPVYSNGLSDEGLYGYTSNPKITDESVTVSARGTIGYVCLRHVPYVPIVRLVTLIPDIEKISAKYLYLWLKQLHITGTGTTQQQLTVPDFKKTEILLPKFDIITSFTRIISPLFENLWENQKQTKTLSELRDILLPKLMSGKIDVSELNL